MIFEFIQATAADREYLLHLRKLTMVEHLEKSGQFLTEHEHQVRLDDQYQCSFLIVCHGTTIGTVKYLEAADTIEVMQLQIHPDHQNQGYGKAVLQQVINQARPKQVSLTVLKDNPAFQLYLRMGFRQVGEDDYEYHMQSSGT